VLPRTHLGWRRSRCEERRRLARRLARDGLDELCCIPRLVEDDPPRSTWQAVIGPVTDPETQVNTKTFRDVLAEHRVHPEPKSLARDGTRSGWHTKGLLRRRPVKATRIVLIGKEATEHDETRAGLHLDPHDQTPEHRRATADWREHIRPVVQAMPLSLLEQRSDMKPTALKAAREGRSTPHPRNQAQLLMIAGDWAAEQPERWGVPRPTTAIDRCAAYLQERANHTIEKTCPVCGKPVDNPHATYCSGPAVSTPIETAATNAETHRGCPVFCVRGV
jgi:hypothetical protein